jgi:hypothetical protein
MIPKFTAKGYLPKGCHACSVNEFKQRFVNDFKDSKSRKSRYYGFIEYNNYLKLAIKKELTYLMNGVVSLLKKTTLVI